jgi:hypothetical protein
VRTTFRPDELYKVLKLSGGGVNCQRMTGKETQSESTDILFLSGAIPQGLVEWFSFLIVH